MKEEEWRAAYRELLERYYASQWQLIELGDPLKHQEKRERLRKRIDALSQRYLGESLFWDSLNDE